MEKKQSQSSIAPASMEPSRLPHTVDSMLQQAPAPPYHASMPPAPHPGMIRPNHPGAVSSHLPFSHQLPGYQQGHPLNNFNHYQYGAYRPEPHIPAGDGHYMSPVRPPMTPPTQQAYNLPDGTRFPQAPPAWPSNYGMPPNRYTQPAYQAPVASSQPPAIPSQNSSAFMMDNIIQPSNDTAVTKASMPIATTAAVEDDDDEMSSYMTMASFVTSKTS